MTPSFVHLHLHSEYSLVDGTLRIPELVARTRELGMPAVALTDQANLFALVKFYREAVAAGIKPIVGADLLVNAPDNPDHVTRIVLLAQDRAGYHNLCQLISRAYVDGQHHGQPRVRRDWVGAHAAGLIALSGAREGDVGQALLNQHPNQARSLLQGWMRDFPGRFYLELQRTGREGEAFHEAHALSLAAELDCPVVATNDVRFAAADGFAAHDARVCIHDSRLLSDPRREKRYSAEQYLKGPAEMHQAFADLPEALENAVEIARRCNLELEFGKYYLPAFPVPAGQTVEGQLREAAGHGLAALMAAPGPAPGHPGEAYRERLETELGVIVRMGFAGYFLIVADFIRWAREQGIPVGPGRGSGAGSLVAWSLGITGLDPLRYDLLFERFLNPERISMPDFDIDFCMDRRDEVLDYVAQKYGRDQVSQIITYGTMAAKAVVRDCGRVLGHGYGFVDSIAKLIPLELGISLDKALADTPELLRRYGEEEDTRAIIDLARSLEGLTRNAGKHAGGVVIAPSPLTDFTPLFCEPGGGSPVTQFDKDDVEAIGLVKFDFLGLRTLTIIDWAVAAVNRLRAENGEAPLDLDALPLDDSRTFELLRACKTTAVFQLESRGMKDLVRRLQPDSFDEIVALVALFRPGPLESGMVGDYIDRKHGRASVRYPHPKLEEILRPTYGVILYQEQVMQIAQVLAGYSLGDADLLRRAMGKKKASEMAEQRLVFVQGAVARGLNADNANFIFDQMETFAGYGFNKSHSAAYALLSYQTAWLKAHHPAAFMAAVLSSDLDNTDKLAVFIAECRGMRLRVLPPDINVSEYPFTRVDGDTIRYGLGAIKGLGQGAVDGIVAERAERGPFRSLSDFCLRTDLQKVNRRALETLIRAGAMDALAPGANRSLLMHQLGDVLQAATQAQQDRAAGQVDLFGNVGTPPPPAPAAAEQAPPWTELQRLEAEKEALGLYLTGHPVQVHAADLERLASCALGELDGKVADGGGGYFQRGTPMVLAGMIGPQRRSNRRGPIITLEDHTGRLEVSLTDEVYAQYADVLDAGQIVVVQGRVSADDFSGGYRMVAQSVRSLAEAKREKARGVQISVHGPCTDLAEALEATFAPYRGGRGQVWVDYRNQRARASLELSADWGVKACEELVAALGQVDGVAEARLVY